MQKLLLLVPLIILTTALSGCITAAGMRENEPSFEGTSKKPLQELVGCLNTRWASESRLPITAIPAENGYTFSSVENQRDITVDVIDEGQQRRIRAYYRRFLGITAINEEAHFAQMSSCL